MRHKMISIGLALLVMNVGVILRLRVFSATIVPWEVVKKDLILLNLGLVVFFTYYLFFK